MHWDRFGLNITPNGATGTHFSSLLTICCHFLTTIFVKTNSFWKSRSLVAAQAKALIPKLPYIDPLIQRSELFFDNVDAFFHQILAIFLKNHFLIWSHIILVTKETAFFLRVFAYNSAFGLLIILSSGQCSPAGSTMTGICPQACQEEVLASDKISQQM